MDIEITNQDRSSRRFPRAAAAGVVILALVGLSLAAAFHPVEAGRAGAVPAQETIVHVVQVGDSLADIAIKYGTTIAAIMEANGLANANLIYPGQRLVIPGPASGADASTPAGPAVYHTVQVGETLARIAASYGVSVAAIISANQIGNPDVIWIGQRILIPGVAEPTPTPTPTPAAARPSVTPAAAQPSASPAAEQPSPTSSPAKPSPTPAPAKPTPAGPTIHVVQSGDTLAKIAARYDTTVAAIVAANSLPSADLIGVGMRLIIPDAGGNVPAFTGTASRFVASISQQRCWLYSDDALIADWDCSTGRPSAPTQPGAYRIQSKMAKAYGSTWNIWMPYWLGIYWAGASENGIHGLPWNAKSGAQVWTGLVGTPITYGCIMLDNINAKMLYDLAYIGMPVIIKP